ncbi:hypothetical protein [Qipengyuania sp. YIM B01966]
MVGEGSGRYLWLLHREATPGEVESAPCTSGRQSLATT